MQKQIAILCIVAIAVYVGCKSNPTTTPATTIVTLNPGNAWHYSGYQFDNNGNKIAGSDVVEDDSVIGSETFNGRTTYDYQRFTNDSGQQNFKFSYNTAGDLQMFIDTSGGVGMGFWRTFAAFSITTIGGKIAVQNPARKIFQTTVGGVTDTTDIQRGTENENLGLLADSLINVPAGQFTAALRTDSAVSTYPADKLHGASTGVSNLCYYFVTNVGRVKLITLPYSINGAAAVKSGYVRELVSYHVQ